MLYLNVKEAAEKWGSGNRIVTLYCAENKIEGDLTRLLAARSVDITDREEGAMPEESHFIILSGLGQA